MLLVGLNKIRDLVDTTIDKCHMGTSGAVVTEAQTALQTPVAASKLVSTSTTADKTLVINYTLPSTTGTGSTYREFAFIDDGTVEYNRVTFTGIEHTSTDDIIVRQSIFFKNP